MPSLLLLWPACARVEPGDPAPAAPYDWTDVAPIIGDRCGACHAPGGIAGLPLSTWQEVHDARGAAQYAIEDRRMPPWPAAPGDYAFRRDLSLTDDQLELLSAWFDAGAPLGDGDPDAPVEAPPPVELPQVDVSLHMPQAYQPGAVEDEIRCFPLVPDERVEGYIRGFQVVVGNRTLLHHARLLSVYPQDHGATLASRTNEDPEPGFACEEADQAFGGPSMHLGSWLPGTDASLFPPDTGLRVDDGVVFLLMSHLHPPGSDGGPEQSRVELWTTPTVERPVEGLLWVDPIWRRPPEEGGLLIPAGSSEVLELTRRVGDLPLRQFDPDIDGVDVVSAKLHLHLLGRSAKLTHTRGDETLVILDVPRWDFDWQLDYWPVEPIHLAPDDRLTLTCTFDNPGPTDVTWGEGTEDEMCGVELNLVPARPQG